MTSPPVMTDLNALALHRARARNDAMFLHEAARGEVKDRLAMVNKSFTSSALVTAFPAIWKEELPDAQPVAPQDTLALAPGAHDLVVHGLALHWANDPVGQLIQCRHALRPDGLFIGVSFGGRTLHELRACLAQAESDVTGGLSPRIAPMADLRDMGALLQRAGFALPVADAQTITAEYADAWSLMRDLRAMGESNALQDRLRRPTARGVLEPAASLYKTCFGTAEGRVTATFELIFLTGWSPSADQPKALRPGSAQQRLADALQTSETKLPI